MRFKIHKAMIAWVLLAALALHSLIPVGYMPDSSGHGWLIACDGTEHMSMPAGADMSQMDHGHCHHGHNLPCPFSAGAIEGFVGLKAPVITPPSYVLAAELLLPSKLRITQPHFSNASPRSPPTFS